MRTSHVMLLLSLIPLPVCAQVFKCKVDGQIVYSDRPCAAGVSGEALRIMNTEPTPLDRARAEFEGAMVEHKAEQLRKRDQAIRAGTAIIGMAENDVVLSMGHPTVINRDTYRSGVKEQWVYRSRDGRDRYVYLENGKVTAIQE